MFGGEKGLWRMRRMGEFGEYGWGKRLVRIGRMDEFNECLVGKKDYGE
jgi:hypothetical protein